MAVTGSYTPTPTATVTSRVLAAMALLAGVDAPNAANITAAMKTLADQVGTLFSRGALLDLGNNFLMTAANALVSPLNVVGSAPATGTLRYLVGTWAGHQGTFRMYLFYVSATRVGVELTLNAAWSNSAALWTSDVGGATGAYAARWRFMQPDQSGLLFPSMDTDGHAVTAAAQTWADTAWSQSNTLTVAQLAPATVINNTVAFRILDAKRLPSGEVNLDVCWYVSTGGTAAAQTLFTLPAGWRPQQWVNAQEPVWQGYSNGSAAAYFSVSSTTGAVSCVAAASAGQIYGLQHTYRPTS